jgi:hypothetical protein
LSFLLKNINIDYIQVLFKEFEDDR